jgi:RimJ/RimL family protein N-acetyltransferase
MQITLTTTIPILQTERTILRPHRLEDFDAYATMWADPLVTRYIGGKPRTRQESWLRFLRHPGMWHMIGFGFWAIEERATGRFIGEAGFHDVKRDIEPPLDAPEAGWSLAVEAHGRGLATEIVGCFLGWGEQHFGPVRTVCITDARNVASMAVARKCGFQETGRTVYEGDETVLFERLPS